MALPPQPKLAIKATHQSMGPNHNTLNVTVSDALKRQAAIDQCSQLGRIEPQQGLQNAFWVHLLTTYTDDQIPSLIDWVNGLQL